MTDNAIPLEEFLGPRKPCPFCGSTDLEMNCWEEYVVCKKCDASAPVGQWQFRAISTELATAKADLEIMAAECRANDAAASHLQGLLDETKADLARAREAIQKHKDRYFYANPDLEDYELWKVLDRAALAPEQKGHPETTQL